ncbi:outer membrane beta-barrel protein [uncultured Roseobacter sp.]|uniref:outer membrane beta-barrel protein n=1 Tax=uncultured Roseobacter sp. TaxID=114847 RepID=UPI002601F019|nr:outer membrane beta-barrel protein [uncultured Roseobacter sp.]
MIRSPLMLSVSRAALFSAGMLGMTIVSAAPVHAQDTRDDDCYDAVVPQPEDCYRANAGLVVAMPPGENTEKIDTSPGGSFEEQGFSISIDNETVAGAPAPVDPRRPADIANARRNVDLRFDGLNEQRLLNVSTSDLRAAYRAGEQVRFRASANYPAYIERAEIRIVDLSQRSRPTVARLPVAANGTVSWTMPQDGASQLAYVLRVYDAAGRFDETQPLELTRTTAAFDTHETVRGENIAAGEGEDRTRLRNIPTGGGRVTASGQVAPGARVIIRGEEVPVDPSGRFVTTRILPAGFYEVPIEIIKNGRSETIVRNVEIPEHDFFGVGLVDLTFGKRFDDDLAEGDPEYDDTYAEGRIAGFVKGTTVTGYRYTASVDTGNGPLNEAFDRLDEKDPRRVISRLDPDDVYPTYGDDSSSYDDAPTSGRFYLRVERDRTRFTFGDFKAGITGTDLLSSTRSLYGAEISHESLEVTEDGNARTSVNVYAASPETLPQRDVLRGTGGSVYFLSRQDINGGSETLAVQVTDPVTGRTVSSRTLTEGVDYEIDYIQGVVILAEPLSSSASDGSLVTSGSSGELNVDLVAQYEYTPVAGTLDGASTGGRVEYWATDDLRVGVTSMRENTGTADQKLDGVDLRYELGEQSYIEAEIAQTEGPGFGRTLSTDGGLSNTTVGTGSGEKARAYSLDAYLDTTEIGLGVPGSIDFYYERKQAGFSTLSEDITSDQRLWGVTADAELNERLTLGVDFEDFQSDTGDARTEAEVRLSYKLDDKWSVDAALAHLDRDAVSSPSDTGRRTDVALRLNYEPDEDQLYYVYGQGTIARSGQIDRNDRIGAGLELQLSEKLSLGAEVSGGDGGFGAKARLGYSPTADNEIYLGYTLDPTRTGFRSDTLLGSAEEEFTVGARYKVSETTKIYGENNWDLFGNRRSLTRAYGVNYTPDARWTFSGAVESGTVRDDISGDFDRDAVSFGAAYAFEDKRDARLRLEYRTDDGVGIEQDRDTWALSGGYSHKLDRDWRFLLNVDALISSSDQSSFRDGEYVEASVGYAYRPVDNERLNMLFRYTYLKDLPGEDQVTASGSADGPSQRSHVLSVDAIYDISPRLSVGGKYGYRMSEIADRGTDTFVDNTAHLAILRFDWHVVHKWDALAEARMLVSEDTDVDEHGFLLGVYRHVGNNAKIGVGYEWGRVSDDLTDLDYDSSGIFVNLVAKF